MDVDFDVDVDCSLLYTCTPEVAQPGLDNKRKVRQVTTRRGWAMLFTYRAYLLRQGDTRQEGNTYRS